MCKERGIEAARQVLGHTNTQTLHRFYNRLASRVEHLKRAAEQAVDHIVRIMVIFLLETLIIPVLLLWALFAVLRGTFELPRHRQAMIDKLMGVRPANF